MSELSRRRNGASAPTIILSVRGWKVEKIATTNDDGTTPVNLDEMVARIQVALRRGERQVKRLKSGKVLVDFVAQQAVSGKRRIRLTQREFDILQYLARQQDRAVSRTELLREIWGYFDVPLGTRAVDQAIVRLRRKLEPDSTSLIRTVHGNGYRLVHVHSGLPS